MTATTHVILNLSDALAWASTLSMVLLALL